MVYVSELAGVVNEKSESVWLRCDACDAKLCVRVKKREILMAVFSGGL